MENQQNDIIELRFSGNGINPYQVKPSEIADLIKSFEQALTLTIKSTHPEVNTDIILFTFDSIHDESLDIRFKPKDILRDVVLSSYVLISSSFTTGEYYKIPDAAIPALKAITKFSKSHDCNGQFNLNNETIGAFTPQTEIFTPKPISIKGETTVTGKLIDVGGDNPNVHLKINDDYILIFPTTEANAKLLAPRLYEIVSIKGIAKWDAVTYNIVSFKLTELLSYSPGNSLSALNKIKALSTGYWDNYNNNEDINNQLLRD